MPHGPQGELVDPVEKASVHCDQCPGGLGELRQKTQTLLLLGFDQGLKGDAETAQLAAGTEHLNGFHPHLDGALLQDEAPPQPFGHSWVAEGETCALDRAATTGLHTIQHHPPRGRQAQAPQLGGLSLQHKAAVAMQLWREPPCLELTLLGPRQLELQQKVAVQALHQGGTVQVQHQPIGC